MKKSLSGFWFSLITLSVGFLAGPWIEQSFAARDVSTRYERARENADDCREELETLEEEFEGQSDLVTCTGTAASPVCRPKDATVRTWLSCGQDDCGPGRGAESNCFTDYDSATRPLHGWAPRTGSATNPTYRDLVANPRSVKSACFEAYMHLAGDLSGLTSSCRNAIEGCTLVTAYIDSKSMGERYFQLKADVRAKERECDRLDSRMESSLAACPTCQQQAVVEAMRPSRGELIAGGIVGGLGAVMGGAVGIAGWRQTGNMYQGYLNQYGGHLEQCAQLAVPCQGPYPPGGGGYGLGLGGGMGGLGGFLGGLGGGLGGMGGGIQIGLGGGMGGGYPGGMGYPGGFGGGLGFPGGMGGGLGYPGGLGGGMGYPGGMGGGIQIGLGGGMGYPGGLGGLGGLGGGLGFPGGMGGGLGGMGGLGGCLGCLGGGGMMGPGMGVDYSMIAQQQQMQMQMQMQMQQQYMAQQQARMQAAQQYSQDVMVAQQQMMQAQARYASGYYGGVSVSGAGGINFGASGSLAGTVGTGGGGTAF